jgi:hypothetical protein
MGLLFDLPLDIVRERAKCYNALLDLSPADVSPCLDAALIASGKTLSSNPSGDSLIETPVDHLLKGMIVAIAAKNMRDLQKHYFQIVHIVENNVGVKKFTLLSLSDRSTIFQGKEHYFTPQAGNVWVIREQLPTHLEKFARELATNPSLPLIGLQKRKAASTYDDLTYRGRQQSSPMKRSKFMQSALLSQSNSLGGGRVQFGLGNSSG